MEILAKTGGEAYVELMNALLNEGEPTSPRGQLTFELMNVTVQVEDLTTAHVFNTARKVNLKILATEYMHLLGGLSSLEQLDLASNGRFTQFANDGRLLGAYGPRIRHQLPRVVRLLQRDPDTRQAVISIWTGGEHYEESRDVPCTLSLQFFRRDDKLHTRVSMRSNDVVLGVPYDFWMFSRLAMSVASALKIETGSYTHTVGSMHLYDRDLGIANDVEDIGFITKPRVTVPPALVYVGDSIDSPYNAVKLQQVAEDICLAPDLTGWGDDYPGMDWYHAHVPRIIDDTPCIRCHCVVPLRLDTEVCARCQG